MPPLREPDRRTSPAPPPVVDPMALYNQMLAQGLVPPTPVPQAVQAPAVPQTFIQPDLGPEDIAWFDSLATRLNDTYGRGVSANQYQQTQLASEQGIREQDLGRRFDQIRERLPGGFQKRGLLNSGIYQAGLGEYATDRTNATSDLQRQFQNQMFGLQNRLGEMETAYHTGMGDLNFQKTARRHAKASTLRTVL